MGVSYGIDLGKLDVCFGGFSPTLMGDVFTSSQNMKESQDRVEAIKRARERAARIEAARESEEKRFIDDCGNVWFYVEIDAKEIRVNSCTPSSSATELFIPQAIDGMPVIGIHMDALSHLKGIERIDVPDSVISIGPCAFRHNSDLKVARLSRNLADFKSDWFRNCNCLEELTLPGEIDLLGPSIFDISSLKCLHIGHNARTVAPGAFAKSQLETITIDDTNQFMKTDGRAIFNADGTVMAALAVPCEEYAIPEGCIAIGNKAFSTMASMQQVIFPESLEVIGNFALSKTGIERFNAPPNLKVIMEKAFFDCTNLVDIQLNEGLKAIEKNAFTSTAIDSLSIPASVERLDYPFAARTALTYSGPSATFALSKDSQNITMDESGGLYSKREDGLHLIRMLDESTSYYEVALGTIAIDADAFANHPSIAEVDLPSSISVVGEAAFKNCHMLRRVKITEGLHKIGKEAFLDTSLESVVIPSTLEEIGQNALVTRGSRHGNQAPTLHSIEVSPGNPKFYTNGGLLLERKNERTSKIVVCMDDRARIVVPPEVDEIAPYAFNGAAQVEELFLSDRISTIGIRGLTAASHLSLIHIDLMNPIEGHTSLDFRFPSTTRGQQQQSLALSTSAFVNVEAIFDHYDSSIVNASSFDSFNEQGLDLYEQATRVIKRLQDPIFLSDSNRAMCERILAKGIEQICVEAAKHDDRTSIDKLVELGYLNKENILKVVDRVSAVQDASMTGYILEISRRWTVMDEMDFEL